MRMLLMVAALGVAMLALVACTGGEASSDDPVNGVPTSPGSDYEARKEVLAPIDGHDLLIRESAPPQYALVITSGLPSGCAAFERIDLRRDGTRIDITVWNTMPASDDVACTMVYGMLDHTVELGTDFEPGTEYTININGETTLKFVAQ
jgi:hypothetical protein